MEKPVFDYLKKLKKEKLISFHMPGHKNGKIFERLGYERTIKNLFMLDTTEIIGTDNLHNPSGIIKKSQINSRKVLFPDKPHYDLLYLVNGSTCGIEASILSTCKSGDKIIINRACHQSAYNSCVISDITPIFLKEEISEHEGIFCGVAKKDYLDAIENNPDASAVFITRPTYYGMTFEIEEIIEKAHEFDMRVIVDEAHGAHFGLNPIFPKSAVEFGADFVIQSVHKTLPSFTQTSILLVNRDLVDKKAMGRLGNCLNMTQSSSPSYIFMMSIELCMDIYEKYGTELMNELLNNIFVFKKNNKNFKIFNTSDPTKIFINTIEKGISGYDFARILRYKYNIQVELSNYSGILLLCTIGNIKDDFDKLSAAINDMLSRNIFSSIEKNINKYHDVIFDENNYGIISEETENSGEIKSIKKSKLVSLELPNYIPESRINPKKAFDSEKVTIDVDASIGKISGEYIIPYPPGVCILAPGEVITKEIVEYLMKARELKIEINGISDKDLNTIQIIDEKSRY